MNPNNAGETSTFQMAYKGDLRQIQALAQQDQRWVKQKLVKPLPKLKLIFYTSEY